MKNLVCIPLVAISFIVLTITSCSNNTENSNTSDDVKIKRELHEQFLASSPYQETKNLSKEKRKKLGIPPNAYNEREWELTMNPALGIPTPFLVEGTAPQLYTTNGAPGNATTPWTERGPLNTGGRTRVVFFDPNDVGANNGDGVDYNRVFAGGVGGGLWVNNDITSASSSWNIVPGIAGDLSVNSYAIDPNNPLNIYIGTGEQYAQGAAIGNGVYQSTDGGTTWNNVNIQAAGPGTVSGGGSLFKSGIFNVNDMIIRDVNGVSEIYVGVGSIFYAAPNGNISNPSNVLGAQSAGLYRSIDNGATWNRIENPTMAYNFSGLTFYVTPNDLEITADNTLLMGTISAPGIGQGGGRIYSSTDGTSWALSQFIASSDRIELATSTTNANLVYAAVEAASGADLYVSNDKMTTITAINEPNDADNGIPATDFTRGQAFYDLVIEVDPSNDQIIYAGGIDLHRSFNGGTNWSQISKWSENPNLNGLNVPFVHADVHALTFKPNNPDQALIGSDGGVSYATSLNAAVSNSNSIVTRNNGYNVTQFYYGDIADTDTADGDDFAGGTQDNGSQMTNDAPANGLATFFDPIGGDGGYANIDKDGNYAVLSVTGQTHLYVDYPVPPGSDINFLFATGRIYLIAQGNGGDFINVAELDENLDVFFANGSTFNGSNGILVCGLGPNAANCNTISNTLINGSRPTAMKVSPYTTSSSKLYLGTVNSRLIRVDNANTSTPTWTEITGSQFLGSVSDIEFGATEQEILVTMHNYGVDSVWYSTDGGATWSSKEGNLPDIPVKAILKNPLLTEEVIIGTEEGIYVTGNFNSASPTWTQTNNGMTSVKVVDLDLRSSDNTILATTHGRGMFTGLFNTLGFEESQVAQGEVKLYPTVNNGTINLVSDMELNDAQVSIYNLSGQEIFSSTMSLSSQEQNITLNNPASGIYIVNIQAGTYSQSLKMIIE
ncbi:MAG: T9SS type A sorting domain-containing protein [Nonlabens sp.]|uniref:T9SS type A sorting domain-containing protein n=1 Tax=Nonlabens sp. TaxID=1888209 RepID=UPI003EF51AB7